MQFVGGRGFPLSVEITFTLWKWLLTKYLKNYFTNEFQIWQERSLWPKQEMIQFSEKSLWGKGGSGSPKLWTNGKR